MLKIVPLTNLKRTGGTVLAKLSNSDESVVITRRGRPAAVLVSMERYKEMEAYAARLNELELAELVRQARLELDAGETIPQHEVVARLKKKFGVPEKKERKR
jgi:prevent-host-death family protein